MQDDITFPRFLSAGLFFVLLAGSTFGCELDTDPVDRSAGAESTGLSVAVQGMTGTISRVRINVETCGGTQVETAEAPLAAGGLPSDIKKFEDRPYKSDSSHAFGDHYFTVDAGCYRAAVVPIDGNGRPVDGCSSAHSSKLQVRDGETTEVLLLSQCRGGDRGGLDVLGTINHPPRAQSVVYRPSKFLTCPQSATICVDATDPDEDPMRAEWGIAKGPTPRAQMTKTVSRQSGGALRECVEFEPGVGMTRIEFKVWDRLRYQGQLIDFDTYFRREGRSERSHHFVTFPIYSAPGQCVGADTGVLDAGDTDGGSGDTHEQSDTGEQSDTEEHVDTEKYVDTEEHVDTDEQTDVREGPDTDEYPDTTGDTAGDGSGPDTDAGGCDCRSAVSVLRYDVDRNNRRSQISSLSSAKAGDRVTAHFTVDPACSSVELSLVSYEASGATYQNSLPQTLHDSANGTFGPGTHSLGSVRIPACYFQAEFVCGRILTGAELSGGQRYGTRKLDWHNGGSQACTTSQTCTRTRGYWSNHHEYASNPSQQKDWPRPEDEHNQLCSQTWLQVIGLKGARGSAWRILAPQWIAAKLNAASTGSVPVAVANAMNQAETLLTNHCGSIPRADRSRALSIKDLLDSYNNGDFGPAHCP